MSCLPAPNPALMSSVTDYGRLQERVRVARFSGYPPPTVSASVKHNLTLFPDLLMKNPTSVIKSYVYV